MSPNGGGLLIEVVSQAGLTIHLKRLGTGPHCKLNISIQIILSYSHNKLFFDV